jgi:hypothetical protein
VGISEMRRFKVARYKVAGFDVTEPEEALSKIAGS